MPVTITLLKGGKHQWHLVRQRGKTESLQDWETPQGTLAKNPAAVISLTPFKELTYGSDGRLTHFLARSSHQSTLKSTCWFSPGATSSITSNTRGSPCRKQLVSTLKYFKKPLSSHTQQLRGTHGAAISLWSKYSANPAETLSPEGHIDVLGLLSCHKCPDFIFVVIVSKLIGAAQP